MDPIIPEENSVMSATPAPPTPSKARPTHTSLSDRFVSSRNPSAGSLNVHDSLLLRRLSTASIAGVSRNNIALGLEVGEKLPMSGAGDGSGGGNPSDGGRPGSSSPETSRGSGAQRPPPQTNPPRRQSGRNPFPPSPSSFYPPTTEGFQNLNVGGPPQQPPPQYSPSAGSQYTQRGGYGQYTMSPQPPMSMVASQPYTYSHAVPHPGLRATDANMNPSFSQMSYNSGQLAPPLQARNPIYPYPRYSPDHSSTSSSPYSGISTSPEPPGSSTYDGSPPSNSPHPNHPYQVQHPPSFSSMHYPTMTASPQFPTSFAHSPGSVYQTQYPPSYQQYLSTPNEDTGQGGTWWYIPPNASPTAPGHGYDGSQRSFQGHYPLQFAAVGRPDLDVYGNPTPTAFPPSPSHQPSHTAPLAVSPNPVPLTGSVEGGPAPSPISPTGEMHSSGQTPEGTGTGTSSSERAAVRRPYHPNPPGHRSEWVMWVGNVPSDATHDELWRFFNQPPTTGPNPPRPNPSTHTHSGLLSPDTESYTETSIWGGVSSIFLISRSNCAFVNFEQEANLEQAVKRFNGLPIRANDPRCPRLVCRVRRRDDDLKAGVGGQRGMGMHTKWVKEQEEKEKQRQVSLDPDSVEDPPSTPSDHGSQGISTSGSPPSPRDRTASTEGGSKAAQSPDSPSLPQKKSSSSGSFASSNSSFLGRHFPKRYFILKSLTEHDLHISVERGVWATQAHNEGILNQAYRNSSDVYLIFGANKSGEFFGYARMIGPIAKSDEKVSWASRAEDPSHSPSASISSAPGRPAVVAATIPEEENPASSGDPPRDTPSRTLLFSPTEHRLAQDSPGVLTPGEERRLGRVMRGADADPASASAALPVGATIPQGRSHPAREPATAPAEMGEPHRKITLPKNPTHHGTFDTPQRLRPVAELLDPRRAVSDFHLDPTALTQQARGSSTLESVEDEDRVKRKDTMVMPEELRLRGGRAVGANTVGDEGELEGTTAEEKQIEGWGTPFKVEWIHTDHLPFYRTRHLRNPWNHDREVKVSRDGTELEPTVGQMLLDEWEKPEPTSAPASPTTARRGSGARVQARNVPSASDTPMPSIQRVMYRSQGGRYAPEDSSRGGHS